MRRYAKWLIAVLGFAVITLPEWIAAVWSLFCDKPLAIVLEKRFGGMKMHHFSPFWITVPIALSMFAFLVWLEVRKKHAEVDVELTPTSGQRPDMLLGVRNQGDKRDFYAQCTPLALRNSPNALARGTFDLKWEHTFDKCVPIGTGASCNLLIATVENDQRNALATMQIWGLSGNEKKAREWSRWNLQLQERVPEYDLEISIFSDSAKGPASERFTLRPKTWYGPLEMVRINERGLEKHKGT